MQRDMELVRAMFREVQERQDLVQRPIHIAGPDEWVVQRHAEMLYEAGFLEGNLSKPLGGLPIVLVRDLSWEGHDFAAVLGNDTVWSKLKQSISITDMATLPLTVIKTVGLKMLESWALRQSGLE